ncbi:MAG: EAL domain-containing protein [Vulcanibacillus sp.]
MQHKNSLSYIEELEKYKNDIEKLKIIFEASNEGFFYMDNKNNVHFYNTNFYESFDIDLKNSTLMDWNSLINPEDRAVLESSVDMQRVNKIDVVKTRYRVKNKFNEYVWIEAIGKLILNNENEVEYMVGSHTDFTERKKNEDKILYMAYHDELSGLYNRNKISEVLTKELKSPSGAGYFLYIDIKNFNLLNDIMDYHAADEVIKIIANRLLLVTPAKSYIARNYSDEFIILINNKYIESIKDLTQNILDNIRLPISIYGRIIKLDVRIGVLSYPMKEKDSETIILDAKKVISMIKDKNILGISYYDGELQKSHLRKLNIERCLLNALSNKEIYLNFQSIVDLKTGKVNGFEALLRWNNSELGNVYPDEFISIAEKSLLINDLGDFVLEEACIFGAKLDKMGINVTISINVSPIQLQEIGYVTKVLNTISRTGFYKNSVYLEITESTALDLNEIVINNLRDLHLEGLKISIDDFGTGYSSINSIISLPISQLKVDRSLINKADNSIEVMKLIELLVSYSHVLKYEIVAEGIETDIMLSKILGAEVDCGQGFLFSKPLLSEEIITSIKNKKMRF